MVFGSIVDRQMTWGSCEATLDEDNKINVSDCLNELNEEINFSDRVVNMSMKYGFMVICTTTQCHVYSFAAQNWSAPFVFDLKDNVYMIVQGAKFFAIIDASQNFNVYSYEGKLISKPTMQGLRVEFLSQRHLSVASDVIALIDPSNPKKVVVFDINSGKAGEAIEHATDIIEMELNQVEIPTERKMCFVDSNRDMFMTKVHTPELHKICNMVDSF